MSCDGNVWFENPITSPYVASIAIKAAELQGRKLAIRFLRKVQEYVFIEKKNISNIDVLTECAASVGLDVNEFIHDMTSSSAAKGFQCDIKITNEMDVHEIPPSFSLIKILKMKELKYQDYIHMKYMFKFWMKY